MTKNKIFIHLLCLISLLSISSCSLDSLISILDKEYNDYIGNTSISIDENRDLGYSIQLLDDAFNAKEDKNNVSFLEDFSNTKKNNDFENAKRLNIAENALDLEYNSHLTPSLGTINSLVIPVEFPNALANKVDNPDTKPTYQSVSSYYYNTSYGNLNMQFDVLDWQMMSKKSSYYENLLPTKYYGDAPGASAIIHEALSKVKDQVDLTKYDNDNDGIIDSLYIIYSEEVDANSDLWWAFQYTVYETTKYDGVEAGYYVFAGYDFLFDEDQTCNTSTFIHETGHMFGLEDYYDYDEDEGFSKGGLGGADMMDYNMGDHNAFSKLSTGWIKDPILVELDKNESTTITINSFSLSGDCIIFADNFDENKGIFQDYFILQLIDMDSKLNKDSLPYTKDGIRVFRVHGELDDFTEDGKSYEYFKYDNSYTTYNLLDAINNNKINHVYTKYEYYDLCAKDKDLFMAGDKISNLNYYSALTSKCSYSFEVISIENNKATIKIYRS